MKIKLLQDLEMGSEELKQYHNETWSCEVDEKVVPLTLVAQSIDMMEATGEDEYKDYPIIPELGIINRDCDRQISIEACGEDFAEDYADLYDVQSYYGFACYVLDTFINTDKLNDNILNTLSIENACLKSYNCRFTGETKYYPAFKTHEDCQDFLNKLVMAYGDMHMALVGFLLDQPVNLIGDTAWSTIEKCIPGNHNK